MNTKGSALSILTFLLIQVVFAQSSYDKYTAKIREHILMDLGWRFALGHQSDFIKDFKHNTSYFTCYAKAGYGDGAAAPGFEDRAWREVDLPHDWAIELPISGQASKSHGYRTIGWQYPETSVGWYRKKFNIPALDFGRKISIQFDGVYRNASVWINGFFLGNEPSGYTGVSYDITDYLNYGGENVVAVRVDASIEEGWFYEGAGIYRHVWLNKTQRLHVAQHGTFITSEIVDDNSNLTIRTLIDNQNSASCKFNLVQLIFDANNQLIKKTEDNNLELNGNSSKTFYQKIKVQNPTLWSIENPYLYAVETQVIVDDEIEDSYTTNIGIRTARFDPNLGFFLNGNNVKIKGVNNHQDHAGIGVAIPDELQEFRVRKLKEMGCNAIRTAHNPPTPELLNICDRLGMLVLDENRLMGINQEHFDLLHRMIVRDRNHPSVFLWSLGNEEWNIEGNEKGELITKTMQDFAQKLDSTRAFTVAISGGWDWGSGKTAQVMGYNYIVQGSIDDHHKKFPWQAAIGTEETNTSATRGVYIDDRENGHLAPTQVFSDSTGTEYGWRFYLVRPFLSGLFYWTGFDYHGEPFPIYWPQINTQYGLLDLCGFPKDIYYYLKSWWGTKPVVHIAQHWNHRQDLNLLKKDNSGKIKVTIYGNTDEVELILNKKSLGKRKMPINGHIDWDVTYNSGKLVAIGFNKNKITVQHQVETTDAPAKISLSPHKVNLKANGNDIAIITVQVNDSKDRIVPTANNEIILSISGPARIIGVGNGDPVSHDPEQFIEKVEQLYLSNLNYKLVANNCSDQEALSNETTWLKAFTNGYGEYEKNKKILIKGSFLLNEFDNKTLVTFYAKSLAAGQNIYLNGFKIGNNILRDDPNQVFTLNHKMLKKGENSIVFSGEPFVKSTQWEEINTNPGTIKVFNPSPQWRCKVFNGLAQVIIRTKSESGEIELVAKAEGLASTFAKMTSEK